MTQWRRRTNSLDEFIFECCDLGDDFNFNRAKFYQVYSAWCKDCGRKPFAKSKVKDLLAHNIVHGIKHSTLDGNEIFRGVRIKAGVSVDESLPGFPSLVPRVQATTVHPDGAGAEVGKVAF